jgi:hypothetical protein
MEIPNELIARLLRRQNAAAIRPDCINSFSSSNRPFCLLNDKTMLTRKGCAKCVFVGFNLEVPT